MEARHALILSCGCLVDVDTVERLEFQHNPNDMRDDKWTAYGATKIPAMGHPRYQYVAGELHPMSWTAGVSLAVRAIGLC